MERDPDSRYRYLRLVGAMGTVPLMLGVGPLVGFFAGKLLDRWLHTAPWLQYVFLGLGFGAAVRYIVRVIGQFKKDIDRM
jgi:ATP synthase protein I